MAVTVTKLPNENALPSMKTVNGSIDFFKLVDGTGGGTGVCKYTSNKFLGAQANGSAFTVDEAAKTVTVTVADGATVYVQVTSA